MPTNRQAPAILLDRDFQTAQPCPWHVLRYGAYAPAMVPLITIRVVRHLDVVSELFTKHRPGFPLYKATWHLHDNGFVRPTREPGGRTRSGVSRQERGDGGGDQALRSAPISHVYIRTP